MDQGNLPVSTFTVTIIAIAFTDLLTGIAVGMVVAVFFILYNNFRLPFHEERSITASGQPQLEIVFSEEVSFLNRGRILREFQTIPDGSRLILDMSRGLDGPRRRRGDRRLP